MKKLVSMALALLLTLSVLTIPAMAETESDDGGAIGYLSFLNLSEEDNEVRREAEIPAYRYLIEHGVMEFDGQGIIQAKSTFYDSLDAMLMGLMSGEVDALNVPDCTAKYLCAENDQVKQKTLYHPEKAEGFSQELLNHLSNGYSFMMLEENSDLRDQFDQAIAEMKEDGTLEELVKSHITDVAESGEPEAVEFEEFDGDPIRVAVTGSLPPMDYVAADGSFAGFNTAILAEIGKRLGKNIELVQVDSVGRALALAQGNVDTVFWTRSASEGMIDSGLPEMSKEDYEEYVQEKRESGSEEENAIMEKLNGALPRKEYVLRDMPEGTVTTNPYYTDLNVLVTLK
jgi:ABC-type amino acid transport substrate-binding protein